MKPWLHALVPLLAAGCALQPANPDAFAFAVMGDTPYSDAEEKPYLRMLDEISAQKLAFVIHVGDIKAGATPCSDELFARRKAQFDASAHPFIYTPGDNEWTDCRRPLAGHMDALERLKRLREVFFTDRFSLGREKLELYMQDKCADDACACGAYPENRFWTRAGVRFVTLNIPGSGNNMGFDAASDAEAKCRDEANAKWLEQAVRASLGSQTRALVVAIQADPWATKKPVYRAFLEQLQASARRLRKPVLFVHGDSHMLTIDQPFRDAFGETVLNITRLETYGSPFVGWVRVTVNPDDPELFSFDPKLVALVPPPKK